MPSKDQIIEEVQAAREAIARESGYVLDRIIDAARARQAAVERKCVPLTPKNLPAAKDAYGAKQGVFYGLAFWKANCRAGHWY